MKDIAEEILLIVLNAIKKSINNFNKSILMNFIKKNKLKKKLVSIVNKVLMIF